MNQDLIKDIDIAYLGTSEISTIVLRNILRAGYNISGLFCSPDKEAGRGKKVIQCPTKILAKKHGIPVFQPKNKEELTQQMSELNPDLAIVFAYRMIIPKKAYETPRYKTINIHPSLLPKYRGPSPLNWPILNGDKETGVSIIQISEKMDAGPILSQDKINIEAAETAEILGDKLAKIGSQMTLDLIPRWIQGEVKAKEQNDTEATYTKMLKKDDGHIDWSKNAPEIDRTVRAFTSWPGSFTFWERGDKNLVIKITQAKIGKDQNDKGPKIGEVFLDGDSKFSIQAKNGVLRIEKLQLEGKRELTSEEFLRGYPDIIGTILT